MLDNIEEWLEADETGEEAQWQYELMGRGKGTLDMRQRKRFNSGRGRGGSRGGRSSRGRGSRREDMFAGEVSYEKTEENMGWYGSKGAGGRGRGRQGEESAGSGDDEWFTG